MKTLNGLPPLANNQGQKNGGVTNNLRAAVNNSQQYYTGQGGKNVTPDM